MDQNLPRAAELHLRMSREEYLEWANSPSTQKILAFLGQIHEQWSQNILARGTLRLNSVEATALETAHQLGLTEGLSLVLSLKDQFPEEEG